MTLQEFQRGLILLGYDLGPAGADGVAGRMTVEAIRLFKRRTGLSDTAAIGPLTLEAMRRELTKLRSASPSSSGAIQNVIRPIQNAPAHGLEPLWLIEARRWLGEREIPGPRSNNRLLTAIQRVGVKVLGIKYTNDDTAWCGAIMAVWIGQTLPTEPLPSIAVRAKSWETFGVPIAVASPGAIMTSTRKGGGHVMQAVAQTATHYLVIGGNQGNAVSFMLKAKGEIDAIRWPRTVPLPKAPLPVLSAAEARRYVAGLSEA